MGASSASATTTSGQLETPADTGFPELDQALSVLQERATSFARAPLADKVTWLRELGSRFHELSPRMVAAACAVKGVPMGSPLEGEEWVAGPVPNIDPARVSFTVHGNAAVEVTPHEWYDSLLYAPFRAKTWLSPNVDVTKLREVQAGFYKQREPEGRVALVLGAGNVASIPVLDVIYKSFVEGSVCLLKMSPVNAYLGPIFELALAPRKKQGTPLFAKRVTSELGNISPVLMVPGNYRDAGLTTMARGLAGMVVQNASFNCNAAKM